MINRYSPEEFIALWSDQARYKTWLDIELAACEAMEHEGLVPAGIADRIRALRVYFDEDRILCLEKTLKHEVISFLTYLEEIIGSDARWLHRGLTSSDITDTALAILAGRACELIIDRIDKLLLALAGRISEHRLTPMIGRSHGVHAEPITFGLALSSHYSEIQRAKIRIVCAKKEILVGKLSGAVGTYAHLSPSIEHRALSSLGLSFETVATQVVARDRHAALLSSLALLAGSLERLATNVRHWQRSEVREVEESFGVGQKGSSAMPHKRNPILSENICGLSRLVRASIVPALENIPLWHERDISHSSVERVLFPDITSTVAFMLDRSISIVKNMVVFPDHMVQNMNLTNELYFSEAVLLKLVESGMGRQSAYLLVQRNAMKAWYGEGTFRQNLKNDTDVTSVLSASQIDEAFSLEKSLLHIPHIIQRALSET
jgi:adenylosuccinate lyase